MSLRPPRRIFSGAQPARRDDGVLGRMVAAGLIGAIAGAFVVLMAVPADLFGRVPAPSGIISADPSHVAVVDGDTLRMNETVVRLQGVAAPRRGQTCHRPDGTAFDCGAASAAALADMLRGRKVVCQVGARDANGVPEALCEANGLELNRRLVSLGFAHARADAPAFGPEESKARAEIRGLWQSGTSF